MFLEKLDYLIHQKGINKNILANESGIPYTTIDGFYKKGYENTKLSTLMKLCAYFNVSLDYLVKDDEKITPSDESVQSTNEFTPHEQEVIAAYRAKPDMQKSVDRLLGVERDELPDPFDDAKKMMDDTDSIGVMLNLRDTKSSK